jgi:dTDP-glucose 4,6-dehydratase
MNIDSNYFLNKKVVVTGAGGFIGSHLTEALVRLNAKVKAFVHYNSRGEIGYLNFLPPEIRKNVEIVAGDLCDSNAVLKATQQVDILFHLGAIISIPYSYVHPSEVVQTNVQGTLNILNAGRINQVEKIIHTSTSEVYGTAQFVPITEKHPLHGQSPYAASKIAADACVESYFCSYHLPVVTVRPFNTFGPRQSTRAVIPVIITQALTGNEVRLGSTYTKRDFTFVDDTVNGFILAAIANNVEGSTFNLGTGKEVSIKEECEIVSHLLDKPLEIIVENKRIRPDKSEVQQLLSDNSLAKEKINWQPTVRFEEGLVQTIDWLRHHLNNYNIGQYQL